MCALCIRLAYMEQLHKSRDVAGFDLHLPIPISIIVLQPESPFHIQTIMLHAISTTKLLVS
jgi:hypothetical protein